MQNYVTNVLKIQSRFFGLLLLLIGLVFMSDTMAYGQKVAGKKTSYITVKSGEQSGKSQTLEKILSRLEDHHEVEFAFSGNNVDINQHLIPMNRFQGQPLEKTLSNLLDPLNLEYEQVNERYYVITKKEKSKKNTIQKLDKRPPDINGKEGNLRHNNAGSKLALISLKRGGITSIIKKQDLTVSGQVTSQQGEPLPGVNVVVQGTSEGTVTDANGNYSLNAPENGTLVFSFVGYLTREIPVNGRTSISINMEPDVAELEEVVVVGYGTLEREKVSTSISKLDPEKLDDQVTASLDRSLEGQIAGLSVKQNTGAPGGGADLRIRGSGSVGAGDEPLVVIDGIPIQNTYGTLRSPLTLIDQSNIASIDVLKGVSATSIYGSRGSNGVIQITTKTGTTGQTNISFNARTGVSQQMAFEKLNLMNAQEFAQWRKEDRFEEANFYGDEISQSDIPEEYRNPESLGAGTDWNEVMMQVAPMQDYSIGVSHGSDDFKGFYSLGYLDEEGVVKETSFRRLSMRANMDYDPNEFVNFGLNIKPTVRWWGNQSSGSRGSFYGNVNILSPLDGPYMDDGPFEQPEYFDGKWDININSADLFNARNPLHGIKNTVQETRALDLLLQPSIQLKPFEGLTFKSQYNVQLANESNEFFQPSTISSIYSPPPVPPDGNYSTTRTYNWQFENTLNYQNTFGNHTISGLAGYTMEHYNDYTSAISGTGYPSDAIKTLNAATELSGGTWEGNWSMISYILRANYDFDSKYLFTGTIRRDGSSRFGPNKRWGYFPSASVGWNILKENFIPESQWLSNLKLRASYGFSGNNDIGNYTWIPNVTQTNYTFGGTVADGKSLAGMGNTNLGWERSRELDVGIDMSLFDGRLNFIADYYNKITEDMLWPVDVPISSGFSSLMKNIGQVQNRGVELAINSINVSTNNLTWETDFSTAFNRNKVLDLGAVERIQAGVAWKTEAVTMEGQPMAMFYGWNSLGILKNQQEVDNNATITGQLPGTPHYEDKDGNGVIDARDKMIIGNPHPAFRGGMNNRLEYKNWDLNISTSFAHDFDVYAVLEEDVLNLDGVFNVLKEAKYRWKSPEEPGNGRIAASFHQTAFDRRGNSDWVYNASFFKINNLSLGYTLDNLNFANNLRLYLSVQNLHMFTNYRYGNPDVNEAGNSSLARNLDSHAYPLTRSFVFGLNLNL